jgi:hypothetical protein
MHFYHERLNDVVVVVVAVVLIKSGTAATAEQFPRRGGVRKKVWKKERKMEEDKGRGCT